VEHLLKLDIYSGVSGACDESAGRLVETPTVVFIYGGSWRSGDKAVYKFVADFLTSNGYNVVIPNYRLHPEAVDDLERFFTWLADEDNELKLDLEHLYIMRRSAGGYNSATYLFNDKYNKPVQLDGFIGLAGPL